MENEKIIIDINEVSSSAEKMQSQLWRISSAFEAAYAIMQGRHDLCEKEKERLYADSEAAKEICSEMERFVEMMRYICKTYSGCAENIYNIISEIKI